LAAHSQDDGFHEIQLNGKQLVFLFMVATVVSVVIFLCGVFVGRGVRAERAPLMAETSAPTPVTTPDAPRAEPPPPASGSDPTAAAPPPPVDDLTYFKRLEKEKPPAEQLKSKGASALSERPASPAGPIGTDSRSAAAAPMRSKETSAQAGSSGWTVQIAALNERNAADAIARRLTSKGYAAYVFEPTDGTSVYRVRVGKFGTRHEAENLKTRLEKEEQFKPYVTR